MHTVDPTSLVDKSRLRRVEKILVSQPAPESEDSPYLKLAKKYNIVVDFFPFIRVEPIGVQDFRNQKVEINAHTAVIFTSRNAVDHFFQLAKDTRTEVDPDMKYFCVSEQTAYYLQKYIVVRKRKIFTGKRSAVDLIPLIKKHKKEKYLFPCSNLRMNDIPTFLTTQGIYHHELIIYCTLPNDLSTLEDVNYDVIAFFSPSGVRSLFKNFPDFQQKSTRIAAFGPSTAQAVREANLILDIEAPLPDVPSMVGVLEKYIQQC